MSIVADQVPSAPLNEIAVLLRAGSDGLEQLLDEMFGDMDSMCCALDEQREYYEHRCQQLEQEKQRAADSLDQNPSSETAPDQNQQTKIEELEHDREALEQELEEVRSRAADLAKTVSEQKRQIAEERAEWTAELRQLRRVLDKQASWIAQQSRQPPAPIEGVAEFGTALSAGSMPSALNQAAAGQTPGCPTSSPPPNSRDPVLGSVLSQFELLRKDLERRRTKTRVGSHQNVNAP